MPFVLLYLRCLSTMGVLRREAGGRSCAGLSVHSLGLAWSLAMVIVSMGGLWS